MNKYIFFIFLLLLSFCSLNGQKIGFGIKLGLNDAKIIGFKNSESITSYNFGVFSEFKFIEKFSIQQELNFSRNQLKMPPSGYFLFNYESIEDDKIDVNYINVPILAKFLINKNICMYFGPQINFLISANQSSTKQIFDAAKDPLSSFFMSPKYERLNNDFKPFFSPVDYSFSLGLMIPITQKFAIDFRFSEGLNNINKSKKNDAFVNSVQLNTLILKNRASQINLQYRF